MTARGLPLARYAPYYADQVLFDLRQGTLDLSVPLHLEMKGTLDVLRHGFKFYGKKIEVA